MKRPVAGRYPVTGGVAELTADPERADGWLLSVDGVPQSHVDLGDPSHLAFEYLRLMADVVDLMPPGELDAVHIGGAACTLPRYVAAARPGSRQLVYEKDAALVQLVRDQLALKTVARLKVRIADGRSGLATLPDGSDDLVVLDAFSGAVMALEMATEEFTADAARVLRTDGVYLVNVADGFRLPFARRVAATVRTVFPHTLLFAEPAILRGRRFGNLIIAGSRVPFPVAELTRRTAGGLVRARCVEGEDLVRFCAGAKPIRDAAEVRPPVPPPQVFGRA